MFPFLTGADMPAMIVVTISPQGEITLETQGLTGPSCRDVSRQLEAALGLVTRDTPTTAFYVGEWEETRLQEKG
ncbi:DUF2997 domain-containing protein [bacterium]|nr:DUF2997 domain-containing protein [bacterium]